MLPFPEFLKIAWIFKKTIFWSGMKLARDFYPVNPGLVLSLGKSGEYWVIKYFKCSELCKFVDIEAS